MAKKLSEENIKTDIGKMSHNHRIDLLHWLNERLLHEFLISREDSKKENQLEFVNYIKLVHSNELITFLNI